MISCLNNLIGVRGLAGYENPDSGYFINDLEGITVKKLEDISDQEDHYEPRLAWEDIYNRSSRLLESDIKKRLKKYYRTHSETSNNITTQLTEKVALTQSDTYNGWLIDLGTAEKNRRIRFNSVSIYLESAVNFSIFIFDGSTGDQLDKVDIEGSQGLGEYRILKSYPAWKHRYLFICYDASAVDTIRTETYGVSYFGSVSAAEVSKNTTPVQTNLTGTETGMMLNYSYECSIDNFVCQRIDYFIDAFQYKLGIEFCKEQMFTERINRFSLMDRDTARELKESFEMEYETLINDFLQDVVITDWDSCFECNKGVMYIQATP